jgi:hypothetical protein
MKKTRIIYFILAFHIFTNIYGKTKVAEEGIYNVKNYGATGDGKHIETDAINKAIRTCNLQGGGIVLFPAGVFITGTFELLSNVTLELLPGSVIKASNNLADFKLKSDFNLKGYGSGDSGEGLRAGLIVANRAKNIAITGHGVIDGNGTYFVDTKTPHLDDPNDFNKKRTRQGDSFMDPAIGLTEGPVLPWMNWKDRPGALIILAECENIIVKDITIKDSHNWTLNVSVCENVEIHGINILNNPLIPNNDGINITAKNARISDCNIWTGDDGIAANECENLVVNNCVLSSRSSGIRFTGGSCCTFQNIIIRESNRGIGIYGGAENVLFSNIIIQCKLFTGQWWGKGEPIYLCVMPTTVYIKNSNTWIKNVRFSNIVAEAENSILIYGTENNVIKDISFENIKLRLKGGVHSKTMGGNFDLRGLGAGPELAIFKHDIPGIYSHYVDGLQIHGFELQWADSLPDYFSDGIYCEYFSNLKIDGFKGRQAQLNGTGSAVNLFHGTNLSVINCEASTGTGTFLSIQDAGGLHSFINNNLENAKQAFYPSDLLFKVMSGNDIPVSKEHSNK